MERIKSFLLNLFLGRKIFQPLFEWLHFFSLKGMNYDRGYNFMYSGERWIMKYLDRKFKNTSPVLFDVGAHTGDYASTLLKSFKGQCTLHSFDPGKKAYQSLLTIKDKRFSCHNIGFSDKAGESELFVGDNASVWSSLYEVNHHFGRYDIQLTQKEKVQLTTIDLFCRDMNIQKINFLKIDVEGHELAVLKGAERMLKNNNIDLIQFEFGVASMQARVIVKDFFELLTNYDIYRILQKGIRKIKYNERMEIYSITNYFAINKQFAV